MKHSVLFATLCVAVIASPLNPRGLVNANRVVASALGKGNTFDDSTTTSIDTSGETVNTDTVSATDTTGALVTREDNTSAPVAA
jgi:hypothetical protein